MTTQDIERLATESRGVDPAKREQIIDGARRMFLAQGFDAVLLAGAWPGFSVSTPTQTTASPDGARSGRLQPNR